jgi:chromosome segregation ATPase
MDFENFDKLEAKVTYLAEKLVSLNDSHQKMAKELENKERQLNELSAKMTEFMKTREKINNKIDAILKTLERIPANGE